LLGNETVFAVQGVWNCRVKARVLTQNHDVAAVVLSGVDKGRTISSSLHPAHVLSNLAGLVSGVVTYVKTGKRRRTHPSQSGKNEVF
jgi:hypothetical protein